MTERQYRLRKRSIIDFTNIDTVYKKGLYSVRVKVDRTLLKSKTFELLTLADPSEVCEVLSGIFERLDDGQEHLVLLTFDPSVNIKGFKVIASGTYHTVQIDEAIIYRNALLLGAGCIVIAHNHPDGAVEPSQADLEVTAKMARIGWDLRIPLLDHIIWTRDKCNSLYVAHPKLFKPPFEE